MDKQAIEKKIEELTELVKLENKIIDGIDQTIESLQAKRESHIEKAQTARVQRQTLKNTLTIMGG